MELLRGVVGIFLMLGTALALCETVLPQRADYDPSSIVPTRLQLVYQQP